MKWTFDAEADAVYVWLADARPVQQVELGDGTIVDLDEAGGVIGIEILSFHAGWDPRFVAEQLSLNESDAVDLQFLATYPFGPPTSSRRRPTGSRQRSSPTLQAHESHAALGGRPVSTESSTLQGDELQLSA